jgi:hypothetical protein
VPAQVDDVEGEITDVDGVPTGQQPAGPHRQRPGVLLVRGGGHPGGLGHRRQGLPVIEVLMGGDDHAQLRRMFFDQLDQVFGVVGRVDQH